MMNFLTFSFGGIILSWPLFQGELPTSWGDWPLTVTVMAFTILVLRIIVTMVKDKDALVQAKDDAFTKTLQEATEKNTTVVMAQVDTVAKAMTAQAEKADYAARIFTEALLKLQTDGHAHGDKMRKAVDRLAAAAEKLNKPKKQGAS